MVFVLPVEIGELPIHDDIDSFSDLAFLVMITAVLFYLSIYIGIACVIAFGFAASRLPPHE